MNVGGSKVGVWKKRKGAEVPSKPIGASKRWGWGHGRGATAPVPIAQDVAMKVPASRGI